MVKAVGTIFTLGGLAAFIYFLIHYLHHSSSISIAGTKLAESHGSIWPIVVCGVVAIIGVIILVSSRPK
jgi:nitrate reductase gamma subunit